MEKSRNTSKEEILSGQEYLNEKIQHKQFKKNQGPIDLATIDDNFIQTENLVTWTSSNFSHMCSMSVSVYFKFFHSFSR